MSDLLTEIARLSDARAAIFARCPWTDADRASVELLAAELDYLYRCYVASRAGVAERTVPRQLQPPHVMGRRRSDGS